MPDPIPIPNEEEQNPGTVPMYTPEGERAYVPYDKSEAAIKFSNWVPGVNMETDQGQPALVPANRVSTATANGWKVVPVRGADPQRDQQKLYARTMHDVMTDVVSGAKSTYGMARHPIEHWQDWANLAAPAEMGAARVAGAGVEAGRTGHPLDGVWQTLTEELGPQMGANVPEMERRAQAGDQQGVYSQMLANTLEVLASYGVGKAGGAAFAGFRRLRGAAEAPSNISEQVRLAGAQAQQEIPGLPAGAEAAKFPAAERLPTQPILDQLHEQIRGTFAKAATETQVDPIASDTPLQDVPRHMKEQIRARSQAVYQKLDKATGADWNRFERAMKTAQDDYNASADIDDPKAETARANLEKITAQRDAFLQKAIDEKKITQLDADRYKEDWATQSALDRVDKLFGNYIRPATPYQPERVTNLGALEKGLTRILRDQTAGGALATAMGEDNAGKLVSDVRAADSAVDAITSFKTEMVNLSSTGQMAVNDIIRDATSMKATPRGTGAQTDWQKALNGFEKMSPGDQAMKFGQYVGDVREFLSTMAQSQAKMATTGKWARRLVGYEALGETARGGLGGVARAVGRTAMGAGKAGAIAAAPFLAVGGTMTAPREEGEIPVQTPEDFAKQQGPQEVPVQTPQQFSREAPTAPTAPAQQPTATGDPTTTNIWKAFPGDEGLNRLADRLTHIENPKGDPNAVSVRKNNPGNLKDPKTKEIRTFSNPAEGRRALIRQLRIWRDRNPNWSIDDLNRVYSPETSEGGDNPPGTTKARNRSLLNAIVPPGS